MAIDLDAPADVFLGRKVHWGIGGYLFTNQGTDVDHSQKIDSVDGSTMGTLFKNELTGMIEGKAKISGRATMGKGKLNYLLDQWAGGGGILDFWYATEGLTPLSPVVLQRSSITDKSIKTKLKDTVDFDLELSARGWMATGTMLISPKTVLTGTTGNSSVEDNTDFGGATAFGGAAQVNLLALDGGTTPGVVFKYQSSDDEGETWVDLATSPSLTKPGSWWFKLPSTTTIAAQSRISWTATGTPTGIQVMAAGTRGIDLN